ncbi:gamma-glutamylcyclotransferase family protein [Mucilaginibacter xinganensis]|uniref:Gamma-L-glutamyl-butirosin B gamma-glutamyl cyclotransferase n=1 Tax=Mucilaginibacter xinganensis TaxID=1234841 RepID=A0A223NYR0_9SPHI|nr:gamma-glutamylcyclotransferase family protein [Mucilaginibacter xinganensis]ASU35019.1 Gamma-L-glutamyl-butirosin B gamma-glutamyl cyclotransferase [Mucilaginibacter xinganensis]
MEEICSYLFVYGSLLDDKNKFAIYLKDNCTFYADGKLTGKLYDIGEYPGAILQTEDANYVHGKVFLINKPQALFEQLDDYEGYGETQPQPNEFIRVLADIAVEAELLRCWTYLYNLPVEEFKQIVSGNYFDQ